MIGVNKVILVGNVGRDPEVRYLENSVAVARFSLATSDSYTNKEGKKIEHTEWHNIVLWRGLAETVEKYVRKGSQLYVEGKLQTRSWEENGVKKYMTEIQADKMVMLGKADHGSASGTSSAGSSPVREPGPSPVTPAEDIDSLPF